MDVPGLLRTAKWIGALTGVAGALIIALNLGVVVYGFALFLISSVLWSVAGWLQREPSLVVRQGTFTIINVVGGWRWMGGRVTRLLAAFTVAALPWTGALAGEYITGVASVIDGDTLEIHGTRMRLHGIDAPESNQLCEANGKRYRCGQQAALALSDRIGRQTVSCSERDRDRYGRAVAVCLAGGDLNGWMVAEGWPLAYRQYSTDYAPAELEAHAARKGMWQGNFVEPWNWRRGARLEKTAVPAPVAGADLGPAAGPGPAESRATSTAMVTGFIMCPARLGMSERGSVLPKESAGSAPRQRRALQADDGCGTDLAYGDRYRFQAASRQGTNGRFVPLTDNGGHARRAGWAGGCGLVCIPVDPTPAMIAAGRAIAGIDEATALSIYRAMVGKI